MVRNSAWLGYITCMGRLQQRTKGYNTPLVTEDQEAILRTFAEEIPQDPQ